MKEHEWMINTLINIAGYAAKNDLAESHAALANAIARVASEVSSGLESSKCTLPTPHHLGAEITLLRSS